MSPMAPRSAGWDVTVVDHATQEELIEKYRPHSTVDLTKIEKVDFIWQSGLLHDAVPRHLHGSFDMLIASHVIEHLPDLVGFLQSATVLLHPTRGILALAVPDKRWCFDCLKPVSTTGQLLAAHRVGSQRHGMATRFDHTAYSAFDGGRTGWGHEPVKDLNLVHTLDDAIGELRAWNDAPDSPYVDAHAWQFTPASFELLILELGLVGLSNWRTAWVAPQPAVEFLTHLVPGRQGFATPADRERRRLELLKRTLLELREQTDWLVEPAAPPAQNEPAPVELLDAETRQRIQQIAETAAMVRAALRPGRAVWHGMLPVRRMVAQLRGRG